MMAAARLAACIALLGATLSCRTTGSVRSPVPGSGSVRSSRGLRVVTLAAGEREVVVTLPDVLVAGDSVSGCIEVHSTNRSDTTPADAVDQPLEGWTIRVKDRTTAVTAAALAFTIPERAARVTLELRDADGRRVAEATAGDVVPTESGSREPVPLWCPSPGVFTLPGRFDGDLRNTKVRIGGKDVRVLAASSRALVIGVPHGLAGRNELVVVDAGTITRASLAVLGMSWDPRRLDVRQGDCFSVNLYVDGVAQLPSGLRPTIRLSTWLDGDAAEETDLTINPLVALDGKVSFAKVMTASRSGTFRTLAVLTPGS